MKDVLAARALNEFVALLGDFADSMKTTFAECQATQEWCLWCQNVVVHSGAASQADAVRKWLSDGQPLPRAKYGKAVQSLTGSPACVYHALAYRDMAAAHDALPALRDLQLLHKFGPESATKPSDRAIFWDYMNELTRLAHVATRTAPPRVPTTEEISSDIAARRAQKAAAAAGGGGGAGAPLRGAGAQEAWAALCASCQRADAPEGPADPLPVLHALVSEEEDAVARCQRHDPAMWAAIEARFPQLKGVAPSEAQWELATRAVALSTMEASIPAEMRRQIDSMASQLAQSLGGGAEGGAAGMAGLDMADMGKRVLSQVSEGDIKTFADNIQRIIPALGPRPRTPFVTLPESGAGRGAQVGGVEPRVRAAVLHRPSRQSEGDGGR